MLATFNVVLNAEGTRTSIQSLFIGYPQVSMEEISQFASCQYGTDATVERLVNTETEERIRTVYISVKEYHGINGWWVDHTLLNCAQCFGANIQYLYLLGCERLKDETLIQSIRHIDQLKVV